MKERIAIVGGFRSAMGKAGGILKMVKADELAGRITKEMLIRNQFDLNKIDEVIFGNVAQPVNSANITRVIALKAGLPRHIPAYTVHRNCASGMEAISSGAVKIWAGEAEILLVGGVESMSNIPLLFNDKMTDLFSKLSRAKELGQKLAILSSFRPSFLKPIIGVQQGLTDPISNLIMGCTAEVLAREFKISRKEQDEFALRSHQLAAKAIASGIFGEEIIPIFNNDEAKPQMAEEDEGIRKDQTLELLSKLKPYFEKDTGTVTVGNSSQLTDGAAAMLIMSESKAKQLGIEVLGYLRAFAYAGLDPERMGLGPVYATSRLLDKTKLSLKDIDLIEINEAFAAQVLACEKAFGSAIFAQEKLGKEQALGEINRNILNVNGGAIALGHPVGMSGARLVLHLLRELKRRNKNRGLATLCVGGGQGAAMILEVN